MDSAKFFKIHIDIAKIRIIYWIVFILYRATWIMVGVREINIIQLVSGIFMSILIIIDFIYAIKSYHNDFNIIRFIRILMAMWASVNIILQSNTLYMSTLSMLLFVALVIQIMYLTNISRFRNKILVFLIIIIPMMLAVCVRIVQVDNTVYTIQSIFFMIVIISIMMIIITVISHIFAESTIEKRKLATELTKIKQSTKQERNQTETALENAYEKLTRENSEMLIETLIQQYISSSLEISNLMKLIIESLSEALVVNLCSIIVKGENDELYQYNSRYSCNDVNLNYFNAHIEDGSLIKKFKDLKEPFIDNQVNLNEYDFLEGMNINSLLIYPLITENKGLGMLVIGKDVNDYFLDNMSFFERVSTQFSIALTNARTYAKMEDMAMKDGLTSIYNRSYMIQKMNEYISSVVLNNSSLAIYLFDIDKFKDVNDRYGHLFGDEVIRVCANIAKEIAEKHHGFAARYGGEEFVIVCKEESPRELQNIAKRLQEQVIKTEVNYRGSSIFVNISIGVAAYPTTCNNPAELLDRADRAMYHSKKIGRGCITFDGEYISE